MARNTIRVPNIMLDYANKDIAADSEFIVDYTNKKLYAKSKDGLTFIGFNQDADDHIANGDLHVTLTQKNAWDKSISDINADLLTKAPLDSAALTGTPTSTTALTTDDSVRIATTAFVKAAIAIGNADSVDGKHVDDAQTSASYLWTASKTKAYVDSLLATNDAMIFKGTIGIGGSVTALPITGYSAGWTYKVITAGTYAGQTCQVGDMIVCVNDFVSAYADSDWSVVQTNIDGAVINSDTTVVDGHVPIFNGATGKIIKTSGKSLPTGNIVGDTSYGTTSTGGVVKSSSANNQVSIDATGLMTVNLIDATTKLTGATPVANGGTAKNSVAANSMLYASATNVYSEVTSSAFGRSLLNAVSGTKFTGLNADQVDGVHVDDTQSTTSYLWTASKTKAYVDSLLASNDAMIFKGTIGTTGTVTALPTTGYSAGWAYKVITAGNYAGNVCEIGDLIICVKDFISAYADSDWIVLQSNLDGGVTSSEVSSTDGHIVVFNGTSGKMVKSSLKSLPTGNVVGDTSYGTSSTGGVVKSSSANNQVSIDATGLMTVNSIDATTNLTGAVPVTNGGTAKNSIAANSMLYASAANTYSEITNTTSFGRSLLAAVSGTKFVGLNADQVDGVHVDDTQTTTSYLWTASKVKDYVDSLLASNDAMVFKGTIGTTGTVTALPTTGYNAGWTYKVITAGTYAGLTCEVGDMIVCVTTYESGTASNADWAMFQSNIDGAVTNSDTSVVDGDVAIFNGATGKIIKTSGKTLPTGALVGTTSYGTSSVGGVVKSSSANNQVSIDVNGIMTINTVDVTKGGTGKTTVASGSMLYASAANVYSEVTTSTFGRSLLNAVSGTKFTGLNADQVDGVHTGVTGTGGVWNVIPVIDSSGVVEIGKYLDFHNTVSDGIDYSNRIISDAEGLTSSSKYIAPEIKATSKVNINDRVSFQYNSTDDCIDLVFN